MPSRALNGVQLQAILFLRLETATWQLQNRGRKPHNQSAAYCSAPKTTQTVYGYLTNCGKSTVPDMHDPIQRLNRCAWLRGGFVPSGARNVSPRLPRHTPFHVAREMVSGAVIPAR